MYCPPTKQQVMFAIKLASIPTVAASIVLMKVGMFHILELPMIFIFSLGTNWFLGMIPWNIMYLKVRCIESAICIVILPYIACIIMEAFVLELATEHHFWEHGLLIGVVAIGTAFIMSSVLYRNRD